MGNTYEAYGFATDATGQHFGTGQFESWWVELYRGESLVRCLWAALRARRHYGCVKVEMR